MKYAIWDKQSNIYTPAGGMYTPEEWMERHPAARDPEMVILCAAGKTNGAFFSTLDMVVDQYEDAGCDFSGCKTPEEMLAAIAEFNEAQRQEQEAAAQTVSADERIADALEDMVVLSMPDDI